MSSETFQDQFEYPVLTKILGPLDYPALKRLKDELKTNASSIHSDLGGDILSTAEYAGVNVTPYVRHLNPPPLVLPPGTAQHEPIRRREE